MSYDIAEPEFTGRIIDLDRSLASTGADLKLVDPKILHFTIRFLGEIDEPDKQRIIDDLKGKVEGFELDISFRGIGCFPSERRISVVWIGVDPASAAKLESHARAVNDLLKTVPGLKSENDERFSPHVTVARVRSGRNKEKLAAYIQEHRNEDFGVVKITKLRLKQSRLTPAGPEYSDLHVFES